MITLVAEALGIGGNLVKARSERLAAKEAAKSVADITRIENGHTWEQTVAALSSRALRWMCALHLFVGMDYTIYLAVTGDPDPGKIFVAFALVPDWFVGLLATMFGWAFASEPVKNMGSKLFESYMSKKAQSENNG